MLSLNSFLFNEQWQIVLAALGLVDYFLPRRGFVDVVAVLGFFVGGREEDEGGNAGRLLLLLLTSARGSGVGGGVRKASIAGIEVLDW